MEEIVTYRWQTPYEWLMDFIKDLSRGALMGEISTLAFRLDLDELQDIYQSNMEADGYFDKIVHLYPDEKETEVWRDVNGGQWNDILDPDEPYWSCMICQDDVIEGYQNPEQGYAFCSHHAECHCERRMS